MMFENIFNLGMWFEQVTIAHGNRTALHFPYDKAFTYNDLNRQANSIAIVLADAGLKYEQVLAISGEKRIETYATIIACLKLGLTYCVLDPDSPKIRLEKILQRCEASALVCSGPIAKKWFPIAGLPELHCLLVENFIDLPATDPGVVAALNRKVTANTPAYIMFTSGSTGFPKGAVMTHQNVMNFIDWSRAEFGISENDVLTNVNPLYFDNYVFDVYASLFNGAALISYGKSIIMDTGRFVASLESCGCTIWFSVPSMLIYLQVLRIFTPSRFQNFRKVIFGGEGFPKAKLKILFDLYNHRLDLVNVYGPTECTCICSAHTIVSEDFENLQGYPQLGYLIQNFNYLILDEDLKPVPKGQRGELCLRGPNVGLGYYNDPERTAEAFIQNPLNNAYSDIIYRTGDLVSLGADQRLYIHGRADNQIKHMGYRIELEEVETALSRLNYVNQAVVVHKRSHTSNLIAIIEARGCENVEGIRDDLRKYLPDYMIPNKVHLVSEIPKNKNGKVDRALLKQEFASGEWV